MRDRKPPPINGFPFWSIAREVYTADILSGKFLSGISREMVPDSRHRPPESV